MLYPRTLNITIYRDSSYDMIVRFRTGGTDGDLLDVSTYDFTAYYYNAAGEEVIRAAINRPSAESIELYLSPQNTSIFEATGTWKLAVTIPGSNRKYFILKGKATVR